MSASALAFRAAELLSEATARAVQPDPRGVARAAEHLRDLTCAELFPAGKRQELALVLAQAGEGGRERSDLVALGIERCTSLLLQAAGQPLAPAPGPVMVREDSASRAVEPEPRILALRDGVEASPGVNVSATTSAASLESVRRSAYPRIRW